MTSEPQHTHSEANGLLELFDPWLLWQRKWSLVLSVVVAAGLATAYIWNQTPIYEVTSRVLIQMQRFGTDKDRLVRTDRTFLTTQAEIIGCPVIVEKALDSLHNSPDAEPAPTTTDAVMKALRVTSVDDANVLKLSYRADDPDYASRLVHAIVENYRVYAEEMQQGGFQETLEVLTQRELELRRELELLEGNYYQMRQDSLLIGQGKEAYNVHMALLEQLGRRLTEARSRRIDKETEMKALIQARGLEMAMAVAFNAPRADDLTAATNDTSDDLSVANLSLPADDTRAQYEMDANLAYLFETATDPSKIEEQLWRSEMRAKETAEIYGPKHPERRAVEAQIAMWRTRLQEVRESAPLTMQQEWSALRDSESHLQDLFDAEFNKVKELDVSLLAEQNALAEIERVKTIHESTATQLRELTFADEAMTDGQVAILVEMIEAPSETAKLVWPRTRQFIGLCAALGFVLGCVVITVSDRVVRRR